MQLLVHESPDAVARAAAKRLVDVIAGTAGRVSVGLAGGSTPMATYAELGNRQVSWTEVDLWLSDERWVPHDHPRSNGRMALEALNGEDVPIIRPDYSGDLDPEVAAIRYEAAVRSTVQGAGATCVLLGLGPDGHTASLFPGTQALTERNRWYVANYVPVQDEQRLTATFPLLWAADLVMVIVCGGVKAEALARSFAGLTPAGLLGDGEARVEWYADQEAASLVD